MPCQGVLWCHPQKLDILLYLRVKDPKLIDDDIVFRQENNCVLTKNIKRSSIDFSNVLFYARAKWGGLYV